LDHNGRKLTKFGAAFCLVLKEAEFIDFYSVSGLDCLLRCWLSSFYSNFIFAFGDILFFLIKKGCKKIKENAMLHPALPNCKKDSQTVAWDFAVFLSSLEFTPSHGPLHFPGPTHFAFRLGGVYRCL